MFKFKKKYRVKEEVMGDETSIFYPEEKHHLIFWRKFKRAGYDDSYSIFDRLFTLKLFASEDNQHMLSFDSIEEANKHICRLIHNKRRTTTVKLKVHVFDEVFHKLKND